MDGGFEGNIYVLEDKSNDNIAPQASAVHIPELEEPEYLPTNVNPLVDILNEDTSSDILQLDSLPNAAEISSPETKVQEKKEAVIDEEETEDVRFVFSSLSRILSV